MSRSSLPEHPDDHEALCQNFRWQVPTRFNMAQVCMQRWARRQPQAVAMVERQTLDAGQARRRSYGELQRAAHALSAQLRAQGVRRGDRVAIVMPQRFETAVAFMAVLQMGAVAVPLSMLFGPDALTYRLQDSDAVWALCDPTAQATVQALGRSCPALRGVQVLGGEDAVPAPRQTVRSGLVRTRASDPALLIYTSGTTGPPKGALIAHGALIGNLSGFVCSQNWFGFDPLRPATPGTATSAVFWSPADWAWTGGLLDALLPTLYFGGCIVAFQGRFSPEVAMHLLAQEEITHTFLFPTALKAMMKAYPRPRQQFQLKLQAIMSAGEAVGDAVFAYCQHELGVTVNEMFGQTELNYIVGNCAGLPGQTGWPARAGSMVIDEAGQECPVGATGDVALHRLDRHGHPDPVLFLGYWKNEAATRQKFTGDWCRTGDLAVRDAQGYIWYQGRSDDVFKSAGYRIGPSEIENCLVKHPAVANAAVVPKPDRERGALVKAYVVLTAEAAQAASAGPEAQAHLVGQLQAHVKGMLAAYEAPKEIEFLAALPMTTTGKVQRRVLRLQEEERARKLELF
jgi:acetyl-CoA synthetase